MEEGVEELEEGPLIGGGKLLDALEALEEASGPGARAVVEGSDAEELVGGDTERPGEIRQDRSGRLCIGALVVGDHAVGDADEGAELGLGEAAALAELGEAGSEAFDANSGNSPTHSGTPRCGSRKSWATPPSTTPLAHGRRNCSAVSAGFVTASWRRYVNDD